MIKAAYHIKIMCIIVYFKSITLVYGLISLFSRAQSCHGLENNGTHSRRFPLGIYADGPLCAVGQTIYIRESHYVALVTLNGIANSNDTTTEQIECYEFVSVVHEKLVFTCENRIACDDMMIPFHQMTCEGYKVHADYLHVSYHCIETNKAMQFSLVCKDKHHGTINCNDNEIVIKDLLLGYKTRGKTCSSDLEADDCLVHYNSERLGSKGFLAQHEFIDKCTSLSSCNITAAEFHTWNISCGNDLRGSPNDYFLAIYECNIVPHRRIICNENEINLSCSAGNVIDITSAWFTFVPDDQNCLGDDKNLLKRCSIKEWTNTYYSSLLLHCQNKTSCDRGLMAKPAPNPGTCFNGQFSIEENKTTDAVIVEYTCISASYILINENNEGSLSGFTYLLVGVILGVTVLAAAAAVFAIARLRLVGRQSDIAQHTKETKRNSERYYEEIGAVEKVPYDERIPQQPIYAEPIIKCAENTRWSIQYSNNVYSEIQPGREDSKDNAIRDIFSEADNNRLAQPAVYAKVNKSRRHSDELELYDNQLYERNKGTVKR